jgi:Na+/melibiose symporter-like transporter
VVNIQPVDMLYLIIAALYLVCVGLIYSIPNAAFNEAHRNRENHRQTSLREADLKAALRSFWRDLVGGWHIIRMDRILFFSVVQLSIVGIIMQLIGALAATFTKVYLNQPSQNMALVLAPAAVGLVGASALMSRITERVGKVRLAFVGLLSLAIGFGILPLIYWLARWINPAVGTAAPLFFGLILLIVFILGIAMAAVNIPTQTMMQERAPEDGRARVLSLQYMLFSAGTIPTLLFAGSFVGLIGFNQTVLVVAFGIFLFWLWGVRYLYSHSATAQEVHAINSHERA